MGCDISHAALANDASNLGVCGALDGAMLIGCAEWNSGMIVKIWARQDVGSVTGEDAVECTTPMRKTTSSKRTVAVKASIFIRALRLLHSNSYSGSEWTKLLGTDDEDVMQIPVKRRKSKKVVTEWNWTLGNTIQIATFKKQHTTTCKWFGSRRLEIISFRTVAEASMRLAMSD